MKLNEFNANKGTYAAVTFSDATQTNIVKYMKDNKIPNMLSKDDLHSTLLYSRKHLPKYEPLDTYDAMPVGHPLTMEIWPSPPNAFKKENTNCIVMKYDCKKQCDRHKALMDEHEAIYDHDEYIPHITLSYDVGEDFNVDELPKFEEKLEITGEFSKDLDLNKTFKSDS